MDDHDIPLTEYEGRPWVDTPEEAAGDEWHCPHCGAKNPEVEEGSTPGFTGAAIYWTTWKCCGEQDVDASGDNLDAAR